MMKSQVIFTLFAGTILFALLYSCNGAFSRKGEQNKGLDTSQLFNKNVVLQYSKSLKGPFKKPDLLFAKGVDEYRNKKNPAAAYDLFVQAATAHPTARVYYELGNVCIDRKEYDHAIEAYNIAEQLGYEPVSKLFYNIACAWSLKGKADEAGNYLEYAIEAGYTNTNQILKDKDLEYAREYQTVKDSYQEALGGAGDPEENLWQAFKRDFKSLMLPLVLDLQTKVDERKNINFEYEKFVSEMRNEKFSRDVGVDFYYYANIESNAHYTALIYAVKNSILSETAPLGFVLVSFDGKGTLIDKKMVGGQTDMGQPYKVCTINPNLHFEVKEFKNTYKNNPDTAGYDNNPIVKSELVNTQNYRINENGKFEQVNRELTMK